MGFDIASCSGGRSITEFSVAGVRQKGRDVLSVVEAMNGHKVPFAVNQSFIPCHALLAQAEGSLPEVGVQFTDYDERQVLAHPRSPPCPAARPAPQFHLTPCLWPLCLLHLH